MFKDQIINLEEKENELITTIDLAEQTLKKAQAELALVKKAKKQIMKLQDQFDGKIDVSNE